MNSIPLMQNDLSEEIEYEKIYLIIIICQGLEFVHAIQLILKYKDSQCKINQISFMCSNNKC